MLEMVQVGIQALQVVLIIITPLHRINPMLKDLHVKSVARMVT